MRAVMAALWAVLVACGAGAAEPPDAGTPPPGGTNGTAATTGTGGPTGTTDTAGTSCPFCNGGTTQCGDRCVDLALDRWNCGACGRVCQDGTTCFSGVCLACSNRSETLCLYPGRDSYCADLTKDAASCGACGKACAAGETCQGGMCEPLPQPCPAGQTWCGSGMPYTDRQPGCYDLMTAANACGSCDPQAFCHTLGQGTGTCVGGTCVYPP